MSKMPIYYKRTLHVMWKLVLLGKSLSKLNIWSIWRKKKLVLVEKRMQQVISVPTWIILPTCVDIFVVK